MKLRILKTCSWAYGGYDVRTHQPGILEEKDPEAARYFLRRGFAEPAEPTTAGPPVGGDDEGADESAAGDEGGTAAPDPAPAADPAPKASRKKSRGKK